VVFWWLGFAVILLFGFVVFRGAPYVPSQKKYIHRAFRELYPISAKDTLLDVGSGDGIVLRIAAEYGAKAIGYELNPALVLISRVLSRGNRLIHVRLVDFWLTPFPDETTVVYGFCVTRDIRKMIRKMETEAEHLAKPIYFISYGNMLKSRPIVKQLDGYYLYVFDPLQRLKAQV